MALSTCLRSSIHSSPATPLQRVAPCLASRVKRHKKEQQQQRGVACSALGFEYSLGLSALVVGAWALSTLEFNKQEEAPSSKPCPTCGGSGYEACACTRWSDGDVGCSSCGKTGYMRCRSCRGGGTAVPIALSIRKVDEHPPS